MVEVPSFIHKSIEVNTFSFRVDLRFYSIFFLILIFYIIQMAFHRNKTSEYKFLYLLSHFREITQNDEYFLGR